MQRKGIEPIVVCRAAFSTCIVIGVGLMAIGSVIIPALPHFQLDRVLTPEELGDPAVRERTLVLLRRAAGNQWLFWVGSGLIVALAGGVGLLSSFVHRSSDD